jgi:hypothetical protein
MFVRAFCENVTGLKRIMQVIRRKIVVPLITKTTHNNTTKRFDISAHCKVESFASPASSRCSVLLRCKSRGRFPWQPNLHVPRTPRLLRYHSRTHRLHRRISRGAGAPWLSSHRLQEIKNGARDFALWANLRQSCELPREFTVSLFSRRRDEHVFHVLVAEFLASRSSPARRDPAHFHM